MGRDHTCNFPSAPSSSPDSIVGPTEQCSHVVLPVPPPPPSSSGTARFCRSSSETSHEKMNVPFVNSLPECISLNRRVTSSGLASLIYAHRTLVPGPKPGAGEEKDTLRLTSLTASLSVTLTVKSGKPSVNRITSSRERVAVSGWGL